MTEERSVAQGPSPSAVPGKLPRALRHPAAARAFAPKGRRRYLLPGAELPAGTKRIVVEEAPARNAIPATTGEPKRKYTSVITPAERRGLLDLKAEIARMDGD